MAKRIIREDDKGLYLVTNGTEFRPGPLYYTLRKGLRTDTDGLKRGDAVKTRIMPNPVVEIRLDDGSLRYWEDAAHKADSKAKGMTPTWDE